MLEVRSVFKKFKNTQEDIFYDLSLHVQPQEFVSIIGPSGCGKTTILELLAGLQNYYRGLCMLEEKPISKPGLVSYMPQEGSLLPWRKLKHNIALAAETFASKAEALKIAENLLRDFNMLSLAEYWPYQLSAYQKRCGTLLRTVAHGKNMLLLDEPLGIKDSLSRKKAQNWLKNMIKKQSKTVLMTTGDIDEAVFLSDRIYIMLPNKTLKEIKVDINKGDRNDIAFRDKCKEVAESLSL